MACYNLASQFWALVLLSYTPDLAVAKWQWRSFVPACNAPDVPALAINGSQTS